MSIFKKVLSVGSGKLASELNDVVQAINDKEKEFELFSLLTSKPGKVFKREIILDTVWGNEVVVGGRTIDVHIRKLREKIGDHHFKTVKGVGYKFVLEEDF